MNSDAATLATSDTDLERRIRIYLENVGRGSMRPLQVRVDHGVAYVSGRVPSFYARQLAIAACRRVAGVHDVTDEIEVELRPRPALREAKTRST